MLQALNSIERVARGTVMNNGYVVLPEGQHNFVILGLCLGSFEARRYDAARHERVATGNVIRFYQFVVAELDANNRVVGVQARPFTDFYNKEVLKQVAADGTVNYVHHDGNFVERLDAYVRKHRTEAPEVAFARILPSIRQRVLTITSRLYERQMRGFVATRSLHTVVWNANAQPLNLTIDDVRPHCEAAGIEHIYGFSGDLTVTEPSAPEPSAPEQTPEAPAAPQPESNIGF